jgi:hypothetical protein
VLYGIFGAILPSVFQQLQEPVRSSVGSVGTLLAELEIWKASRGQHFASTVHFVVPVHKEALNLQCPSPWSKPVIRVTLTVPQSVSRGFTKGSISVFLQRCPNSGERGSMTEKGTDGRHGASFQSVGAPNSFRQTSATRTDTTSRLPISLGSTNKRYEPSELRFYFTLAGDAIAQLIVIPAKRP